MEINVIFLRENGALMLQYTFVNVHENGVIFSAKCALGGLLMSHYTFVNVHENECTFCPTLK